MKILIITRHESISRMLKLMLGSQAKLSFEVENIEAAEKAMKDLPLGGPFTAVIVDCNLERGTSEAFIRKLVAEGFKGAIIGMASFGSDQIKMEEAGCHIVAMKPDLLPAILRVLES